MPFFGAFRRGSIALAIPAAFFLLASTFGPGGDPAPMISAGGGIQTGNSLQPLVFTWNSPIPVEGSGWSAGEAVGVSLQGPLNMPGVTAGAISLGTMTADGQGTFSGSLTVPYDGGITGSQANIPRPGLYSVQAAGATSGIASAEYQINLSPATYTGGNSGIDWSHERGTRPGVLPGPLATYSPERSDPNWISVWDNRPVGVYGKVTETGAGGANQPARVTFEDDPLTHYAHDTNFYLLPDPQYRWTVGTANYYSNGEDDSGIALGRIEVEWEALNNGTPDTYGSGSIGLPDWAIATSGDRMYVVGRWVLDCGHPEMGDRTEMHPPRLVAVMRQRPAVTSAMNAAAQVDIYVSGHGGGANLYPSGLDALLDQGGRGGGRIRDVLSPADQQTYYQPGPLPDFEVPLVDLLIKQLSGGSAAPPINAQAGPSAFSWGKPAPENQPVNDMDYDFDVPLPAPPAGAGPISLEVVTHAQHSTGVTESVTYGKSADGSPVAHIHLPYRSADNGIYARTLKFSWNAPAPPHHFRVTLDHLTVTSLPGKWQMWIDAGGQWTNLLPLAPALLNATQGQPIPTPGAQFDLYLRDNDTLRVLVQGYHAQCVDGLFGTLFGKASYDAGIQLLVTCGPVNNDDLGGALLEIPALPSSQGTYTVTADAEGQTGGGAFQAAVRVDDLSAEPVSADCQGRGSLSPAIAPGGVVGAGLGIPAVTRLSPDGLLTIFGQNFAPAGTARGLTGADLQAGQVPVNLGCTCVAVNHQLAPLVYVSPTQINLQAPSGIHDGGFSVQVIANCGAPGQSASAAQTVSAQPAAPEFFFFQQNASGTNPVAAEDAVTGALIGPAGLLPGAALTPAKPGEFVALYATGLGLTDPAFAAGSVVNQIARGAFPVSVTLNGVPLPARDILYAGAAPGYAGLYQINIQVPAGTPSGNLPVGLSIGGLSTSAGAFLAIGQ